MGEKNSNGDYYYIYLSTLYFDMVQRAEEIWILQSIVFSIYNKLLRDHSKIKLGKFHPRFNSLLLSVHSKIYCFTYSFIFSIKKVLTHIWAIIDAFHWIILGSKENVNVIRNDRGLNLWADPLCEPIIWLGKAVGICRWQPNHPEISRWHQPWSSPALA